MADDSNDFVAIATFPTERLATEAVRRLVEHGVGGHVVPIAPGSPAESPGPSAGATLTSDDPTTPPASPPDGSGPPGAGGSPLGPSAAAPGRDTDQSADRFEVQVMRQQVDWACEALGVAVPQVVAEAEATEQAAPPPWKRILLIWAVAIVLVPLIAGVATYLILSR